MNTRTVTLLACTALCVPVLDAQERPRTGSWGAVPLQSLSDARGFRHSTVPGHQVEQSVEKLVRGLRWRKSLGAALAAGRAQQKPVLWIHALGDLDGFL